MTRYYNKVTKTEAIEGIHSIALPDVVELPPENLFWGELAPNTQLTYDINQIPNGIEFVQTPLLVAQVRKISELDLEFYNRTTDTTLEIAKRLIKYTTLNGAGVTIDMVANVAVFDNAKATIMGMGNEVDVGLYDVVNTPTWV